MGPVMGGELVVLRSVENHRLRERRVPRGIGRRGSVRGTEPARNDVFREPNLIVNICSL